MDNIIFIHGNLKNWSNFLSYKYHLYIIWKYLFLYNILFKIVLNKINILLKLFVICNKIFIKKYLYFQINLYFIII